MLITSRVNFNSASFLNSFAMKIKLIKNGDIDNFIDLHGDPTLYAVSNEIAFINVLTKKREVYRIKKRRIVHDFYGCPIGVILYGIELIEQRIEERIVKK